MPYYTILTLTQNNRKIDVRLYCSWICLTESVFLLHFIQGRFLVNGLREKFRNMTVDEAYHNHTNVTESISIILIKVLFSLMNESEPQIYLFFAVVTWVFAFSKLSCYDDS